MTKKKLDQYRERLRQLVGQVQHDAWAVEELACVPTGGQAAGGLSNVPMHLGDIGTDMYLQELNGVLLENERYLLDELRAALRRLDEGTFGRCENCGRPINEERLDALPFARNCVECSAKLNPGPSPNLNVGRPKTETETIAAEDKLTERRDLREDRGQAVFTNFEADVPSRSDDADIHAVGTAGGGTSLGGLAGTNVGRGDPHGGDLEKAAGSGQFDTERRLEDQGVIKLSGSDGGSPTRRRTRKRTAAAANADPRGAGRKPKPRRKSRSMKPEA